MMHKRSGRLLALLTSALLLMVLVGSASANHLSRTEQNFRVTYSPLSFIPSFGSTVTCPVTLEGTFHSRTLSKIAGSLIGYINRATTGTCSFRMRMNTETLPWHEQFAAYQGTLPNITAIQEYLVGMSFEIEGAPIGLPMNCRYTVPSKLLIDQLDARGVITASSWGEELIRSETAGCPELRLSGTGSVKTPTGGTIVVRLI